ncbi:CHRD domain-containing protein [Pontibacter sp. BT310]|uniref:CHRD domain-containing protein n=1 Tax=Pontibacter populi TaxID=890055 RepID=A0ABS6XG54_9BACT|nr:MULTISPECIES: CHRD domain-containing protein [Pontibacter]MBJ6120126.1 CHRD domain-containing protein [Pontibacter sp. BT310]MBR0572559.1 CHRD domain-containing protein [Microvirga sp. STS03]MBW3366979.1 CHRD domain-containing protein [Pontibacter populi]
MKKSGISILRMLAVCLPLLAVATACDDDDDDGVTTPPVTDELVFKNIQLSGANERPDSVETTGTGTFNGTYDDDTNVLSYTVTWTLGNPQDSTIAMHFHGPADTTESAPPVIPVTGFTSSYTGTLTDETAPLTSQQEADLKAGLWYFNIHSTTYPNGELRGQLLED